MPSTATDRIEAGLLAEIQAGLLEPGDRLPPEAELKTRFDASSYSVTSAINRLQRRGLIESHVGKGRYVRSGSVSRSEYSWPHTVVVDDIDWALSTAVGWIAAALAVPPQTEVLTAIWTDFTAGEPTARHAMYRRVDGLDRDATQGTNTITARMPTEREAADLQIDPVAFVLCARHLSTGVDEVPVEVHEMVVDAMRSTLRIAYEG